jgi:hypothetical protein
VDCAVRSEKICRDRLRGGRRVQLRGRRGRRGRLHLGGRRGTSWCTICARRRARSRGLVDLGSVIRREARTELEGR